MDSLITALPGALLIAIPLSLVAALAISRAGDDRAFLLRIFLAGLLLRVCVGVLIYALGLQDFFGGDARTYDVMGDELLRHWGGEPYYGGSLARWFLAGGWGMIYLVGSVYFVVGRNPLAVQFVSAVAGAATAPIIFLCARQIFNGRVARNSALFVAFFPSLVLWSSQGLKDGFIVFLLALVMLLTIRLGKGLRVGHALLLAAALYGLYSLRFYVCYITVVAVVGGLVVGTGRTTLVGVVRNFVVLVLVGLTMIYLGVAQGAAVQVKTFGSLEAVQAVREDQQKLSKSSFGEETDVSTTSGALSAIPLGAIYLLFAPFPWQLASLRQSITLPEMLVWWASFPLLISGLWYTIKRRLRPALPIIVFLILLTLAYSVLQGDVGTAYRQRSQLLVFYFIFISAGYARLRGEGEPDDVTEQAWGSPDAAPRQDGVRAFGDAAPPASSAARGLFAAAPERLRAKQEMYAAVRADFLSCPGATEADFERLWPEIRDEIFTRGAYRALARWSPHFVQSLPEGYAEIAGGGALAE